METFLECREPLGRRLTSGLVLTAEPRVTEGDEGGERGEIGEEGDEEPWPSPRRAEL